MPGIRKEESMRLEGKTAIITGAASGFGHGMAQRFAREGARVAVLDINGKGAAAVAGEIGNGAIALKCDLTLPAEVQSTFQSVYEQFSRVDVMVNNAGWSHRNMPMLEVDETSFDRVFAINVKSIYLTSQSILPHMRANGGGAIVNISSTAAMRPRPGLTWYNATKGAVNTMTKSMAVELAPDSIRVNAIAPVIGATGLLETFMGVADTPQNRAKFLASIPLGRFSDPADIAAAAVYLASDDARFVTGVVLEVDGGRCI
jgi:3-oxoacyl-[acyl-carrier protein] reductase